MYMKMLLCMLCIDADFAEPHLELTLPLAMLMLSFGSF